MQPTQPLPSQHPFPRVASAIAWSSPLLRLVAFQLFSMKLATPRLVFQTLPRPTQHFYALFLLWPDEKGLFKPFFEVGKAFLDCSNLPSASQDLDRAWSIHSSATKDACTTYKKYI